MAGTNLAMVVEAALSVGALDDALVERLERGDLQLEDALRSFERGVQLTRQCQGALAAAQQKVEILLNAGGDAQVRDFSAHEAGTAQGDD